MNVKSVLSFKPKSGGQDLNRRITKDGILSPSLLRRKRDCGIDKAHYPQAHLPIQTPLRHVMRSEIDGIEQSAIEHQHEDGSKLALSVHICHHLGPHSHHRYHFIKCSIACLALVTPQIVLCIIFIHYCRNGRLWSYVGASILGAFGVMLRVVISSQPNLEVGGGLPVGVTIVYIVLGALVSLKSYESALELWKQKGS